jgi:hypothetical protein
LVAWYCTDTTPTKASAAVEGTDFIVAAKYDATATDATNSDKHMGPNGCMSDDTNGYNICFNSDSITELNKVRKNHKEADYEAVGATGATITKKGPSA